MVDDSRGVDMLFHEPQSNGMLDIMIAASQAISENKRAQLFEDIQTYHTTPVEAAEVTNGAGVKDVRPDNWTLSVDGTKVTLPIGSDEIVIGMH